MSCAKCVPHQPGWAVTELNGSALSRAAETLGSSSQRPCLSAEKRLEEKRTKVIKTDKRPR